METLSQLKAVGYLIQLQSMSHFFPTAADMFVSYLLLDALVGNTDRHHENWGVLDISKSNHAARTLQLAPSYDHASSLGRNLTEKEFAERLSTRDRNRTVEAYVDRTKSAFYADNDAKQPVSPIAAFQMAAEIRPEAAEFWLNRLQSFGKSSWVHIISEIPGELMSTPAKEFVDRMLSVTKQRLLESLGTKT
jgi:hypothetical protein